jgi:hypothetical protein
MSKLKKPFPPDAGEFISLDEAMKLRLNYDNDQTQKKKKDFTKAFAFGKDKVIELLSHPECVGLRIYYGIKIDSDGDGIKEKKMVLVGVDKNGDDILPAGPTDAVAKAAGSTALVLDGGLPCPVSCSTKP